MRSEECGWVKVVNVIQWQLWTWVSLFVHHLFSDTIYFFLRPATPPNLSCSSIPRLIVVMPWSPVADDRAQAATQTQRFQRSRSLYVDVRPSVCRLAETFVHPTQAIEIFRNVSTPFGTLASCWLSGKILRRSSHGNPSAGGVERKGFWTCQRLYIGNGARQEVSYY